MHFIITPISAPELELPYAGRLKIEISKDLIERLKYTLPEMSRLTNGCGYLDGDYEIFAASSYYTVFAWNNIYEMLDDVRKANQTLETKFKLALKKSSEIHDDIKAFYVEYKTVL